MSFYLIMNGKLKSHQFDYLSEDSGRRLEATRGPNIENSAKPLVRADESATSWVIEIMSKEVETLKPTTSFEIAIELFQDKKIHHIPLVEGGNLMGMISDRDIMWLNLMEMDKSVSLEKFMNNIVLACHEDTPIDELAHVFYTEKINGMPVINSEDQLVGIVTHHDILRWVFDKK